MKGEAPATTKGFSADDLDENFVSVTKRDVTRTTPDLAAIRKVKSGEETDEEESDEEEAESAVHDGEEEKQPMDNVLNGNAESLPYTFQVPGSYSELAQLFGTRPLKEKLLIIHRIRVCNHASLASQNKAKMEVRRLGLKLIH